MTILDQCTQQIAKHLDQSLDALYCERHNEGGTLLGNTQESDLRWLARVLFESSRLGAGDVRSVPWLMSHEEFLRVGLTPQALFGGGPTHFDRLQEAEQDAWMKLARIVLYVLPRFAERVGHRYMAQAKVLRAIWGESIEQEK